MGKRKVGDAFSGWAKAYGKSDDHVKGVDLAYIENFVMKERSDSSLDVSTGTGHTAAVLRRHCPFVVALDLAPGMLKEGKRIYGCEGMEFVQGDAEKIPFRESSFSLVTCRIASHHYEDVGAFLKEARRVLRQEGHLIVVDSTVPEDPDLAGFINEIEWLRDETHVRSLPLSEWRSLFEKSSLTLTDIHPFRKAHDFSSWLARTDPQRERREALKKKILRGTKKQRDYFEFLEKEGKIISYTDDKTIFLANKG